MSTQITQIQLSDDVIIGHCFDDLDKYIEMPCVTPMDRHIGIVNTLKRYLNEFGLYAFWQMLDAVAGFIPFNANDYNKKFESIFKIN